MKQIKIIYQELKKKKKTYEMEIYYRHVESEDPSTSGVSCQISTNLVQLNKILLFAAGFLFALTSCGNTLFQAYCNFKKFLGRMSVSLQGILRTAPCINFQMF